MYKFKKSLRQLPVILFLAAFAAAFALPIVITFTNSFMTAFEVTARYSKHLLPSNVFYRLDIFPLIHFTRMSLAPSWVSFGQYINLFQDLDYLIGLWNSIRVTAPSVVGSLVVSVPAAYAFEVSRFRHKEKLFFVYVVTMLMPLPVVIVPQFVMAGYLGISESVLAVILPAIFAPFGVFLLRQFMKQMPHDILEAAHLDGAGHLRILVHIVTPVMKPAIVALALLVFVDYWNVVDQAIVFITDPALQPLSVGLGRLTGNFNIIFAASFFYMLPALLVFMHGQDYLVEGMKMSGIN